MLLAVHPEWSLSVKLGHLSCLFRGLMESWAWLSLLVVQILPACCMHALAKQNHRAVKAPVSSAAPAPDDTMHDNH